MKMIVIGASAGSLDPMQRMAAHLDRGIEAAILIVRHTSPDADCVLAEILRQNCALPVSDATHGMPIEAGTLYIAPPGHNTTLSTGADGQCCLVVAPIEADERLTPNVDKALVSAARLFGTDCIGVILSGYLDDGTRGAQVLDSFSGTMIVQDPDQAINDSMPWNVIERDSPNYILQDVPIAELLNSLSQQAEVPQYLRSRRVS